MTQETKSSWDSGRELGYLLLRLALGAIFIAHGGQKMFGWFGGHGWNATINGMSSGLGIPSALVGVALLTEFFGGVAVLVGAFTRSAALGLAITMLVATFKVHWASGFFMNWENTPNVGHGIEMNLALLGMALFLVLAGPGRWAVLGDVERRVLEGFRVAPRRNVAGRTA